MAKIKDDEVIARAYKAYAKAHFGLKDVVPTELEMKGMRAALQALAEHDRGDAEFHRVGGGDGVFEILVFQDSKMWALGEHLSPDEAAEFVGYLFGYLVGDLAAGAGEFPPEPD